MEFLLGWLLGCFVFWYLLRNFTRLRGGMAVGVTIMAGSLPFVTLFFSLKDSLMDGSAGVLFLLFLGALIAGLLALGLVILLLSALFGGGKKPERGDGALPSKQNDAVAGRAGKDGSGVEIRNKDEAPPA